MKLLHKLLPVATIASVAAVVTPLVTSCGPNYTTVDGKKDITEEMKTWEHNDQTLTQDKAFEDFVAHKDAFKHDFQYYLSEVVYKQAYSNADVIKGQYANVKLEKIDNYWYATWDFVASINLPRSSSYYKDVLKSKVNKWPVVVKSSLIAGALTGFALDRDETHAGRALDESTFSVSFNEKEYTLTGDKKQPDKLIAEVNSDVFYTKENYAQAVDAMDQMYISYITQWASFYFKDATING